VTGDEVVGHKAGGARSTAFILRLAIIPPQLLFALNRPPLPFSCSVLARSPSLRSASSDPLSLSNLELMYCKLRSATNDP
jgi:hypothetical protein